MSFLNKALPLPIPPNPLSAAFAANCGSTKRRLSSFHGTVVLGITFEVTTRYADLVPIGMGVSGIVCSASDLVTKDTVAVKKLNDPFRTDLSTKIFLREIRLLQQLRHENVISLTDMFISPSEDIYIVTEHVHTDLTTVLETGPLEEKYAQFFFYQMMRGLKYIHSAGVVHRDLKPCNLLIEKNCDLKICDFGLARVQEPRMTGYVSTRYYRAPEIMLSWQRYNEMVDIWSAGCILAEMLQGQPLFPGRNHIHQFTLIVKLLGKPPLDLLKEISNIKTLCFIESLPDYEVKPIRDVIRGVDPSAIDILEKLLVFDARKRPSAQDILESPYLAQYHDPTDEPVAKEKLDWSFLKADLPLEEWKRRVYAEILGYGKREERPHPAAQLRKFKPVKIQCLLKLSSLVLWTLPPYGALRTSVTIAAAALDLAAAASIALLSPLEHSKSLRRSTLLGIFLFFTTILDVARVRTDWLRPGSPVIPAVSATTLAVKVLLLFLEAISKAGHSQVPNAPERTSGIYSLSFFAWLNPLIYRGNRGNLEAKGLYPVDDHISSASVDTRVQGHWDCSSKNNSYSLLWAITKALWAPITAIMIPRCALIALSIAQPFLVHDAIDFVENRTKPNRYGYGLIGAFGITYLGIAVSTAWYQYLTARALTMIRAALINVIYKSSLDMAASTVEASSPISLMGADVERVMVRLRWVLSTAPNIIQVAVAFYILGTYLGPICVLPIPVILVLTYASSQVAKKTVPRQREWMQAVQTRVSTISDVLGTIKGMKMLGLTEMITGRVQGIRERELYKSKRFRRVQIVNITIGNAANILSPIVTFIGYGIIAKYSLNEVPSAGTIFSSLSLLSLLINPLSELAAAIPNLSAAVECCSRIQKYATGKKRVEFRSLHREREVSDIGMKHEDVSRCPNDIELKQVNAGWSPDKAIVQDVSVIMSPGTLTIVTGPIGCGKSTFLKTLLSETILHRGSVTLSTDDIAYCDQTPFLWNQSIRQNIVGSLDYDEKWYHTCLRACALDVDICQFSDQHESLVGSRGISLSGGQKQRLTIARALYARKKIVLTDDCLSELDLKTERHCFHHLLSRDGLIRQNGATVVLVTHSIKWLPYSDQVIVLSSEGRILQSGTYQSLVSVPGYLHDLDVEDSAVGNLSRDPGQDVHESGPNPPTTKKTSENGDPAEKRGPHDFRNLLYYLNTMGYRYLSLFLFLVVLQVTFTGIQSLWLSWWVDVNRVRPDTDLGKWLGIYALFGILALAFLGISGGYYLISLVPSSANILHHLILKSTMRAPMTFISTTDSGSLLNRFSQDMTLMDMQLPMSLLLSTSGLGNTIAGAILTCVSSGYMALCLPVLGVTLFYLQKIYLQTSRQIRLLDLEAKSPLNTHLTETLDGIRTIRAFKWTRDVLHRNFALLDLAQRPFYLLLCLQNWLNLVLGVFVACLATILVTMAVTLRHSMNSTLLGVALVSIVNFSQTISTFVSYWTNMETSLGAVARTRQFVAETPIEPFDGEVVVSTEWPSDISIEFKDVSASYHPSGPDVLKNIDLTIDAGQRVAICGRTGSGKSTLVMLLLRLLDPKSGSVLIGHRDISSLTPESVRRRINSLAQDPWFLPGGSGTVRSNIDPLSEATDPQIHSVLQKTRLANKIQEMGGLDAEMRGNHLSAGQRQLFCLARAMLMKRSKILLLDEATSSVDIRTEELMMSLLRTDFRGWTVIAIVHRLNSILDFDQVLVLDQGRIVEYGNPKALLANECTAFAKLCWNKGE